MKFTTNDKMIPERYHHPFGGRARNKDIARRKAQRKSRKASR